jgi:hypothetical protein
MGNRRLYKIECLHTLGTPESERLKVTGLNLFHPTASPLFEKWVLHIMTQPPAGRGKGGAFVLVLETDLNFEYQIS